MNVQIRKPVWIFAIICILLVSFNKYLFLFDRIYFMFHAQESMLLKELVWDNETDKGIGASFPYSYCFKTMDNGIASVRIRLFVSTKFTMRIIIRNYEILLRFFNEYFSNRSMAAINTEFNENTIPETMKAITNELNSSFSQYFSVETSFFHDDIKEEIISTDLCVLEVVKITEKDR